MTECATCAAGSNLRADHAEWCERLEHLPLWAKSAAASELALSKGIWNINQSPVTQLRRLTSASTSSSPTNPRVEGGVDGAAAAQAGPVAGALDTRSPAPRPFQQRRGAGVSAPAPHDMPAEARREGAYQ